ncbi:MAG TPA: hypothetical protein VGM02_13240 [Acidobacteriaceae bacterium]|jgi:hypothetical protein
MRRVRFPVTRLHLIRLCLATLLFACTLAAHAQGCSMCRDTTAGSAPQIRAGLRRAIPVLAIPAIALFVGFFVVAGRTDANLEPTPERAIDAPHRRGDPSQ